MCDLVHFCGDGNANTASAPENLAILKLEPRQRIQVGASFVVARLMVS